MNGKLRALSEIFIRSRSICYHNEDCKTPNWTPIIEYLEDIKVSEKSKRILIIATQELPSINSKSNIHSYFNWDGNE